MSGNFAASLVQFAQFSGLEMNACLVLESKPARQEQKFITLRKYVQKYPQGWKKRLELANLLYQMGNWQQAVVEYHQVIEQQPHLIDVRLQLGKILQLMGRQPEAIAIYEHALSLSKNQGTQHHIKGLMAVCWGESQKAIIAFNSAASLEPDKVVHWLALAQVHQHTENPLGVLDACEQVFSINPYDVVALIYSYDALLAWGDLPAASERLSRLIALAGEDLRVRQRQIEQRLQMRLISGKEGKLTKKMIALALQQAPHGAAARNSLAYYHILRGDWAQGGSVLAEFAAEHPHHPYSWYFYGRCLFETGEYQRAAEMMGKAYHLYPNDYAIHRAWCEILPFAILHTDPPKSPLKRGTLNSTPVPPFLSSREEQPTFATITDTPKSPLKRGTLSSAPVPPFLRARGDQPLGSEENVVEEMLRRFPEHWSVWATAGRVLVEHFQEVEWGCRVSEQGTKLQPQLADAWLRHGRVLALAGKHQEAVEALAKGRELLPIGGYLQLVPGLVWLGESYRVLGDAGASQGCWEAAAEGCRELKGFNPAAADYWLGRALAGLGERLGAIQAYQSALSQQLLYPARGEVEKIIQRLKDRRRKDSGA
jgi:tetratricopeptide (TPR) repeat protein